MVDTEFEALDDPGLAEEALDSELRDIADGISDERWATGTYRDLEQAIDKLLAGGDEEEFWTSIDTIEDLIQGVTDAYEGTTIVSDEVTLESFVTHHLWCEGVDEWLGALALLRDESVDEPDWDFILQKAEHGNRLLVAIQIYNQRVQSILPST